MSHSSPVVTIGGQQVEVESVDLSSGSPVDLHLPPQVGGVAGTDADIDVVGSALPWSPLWATAAGSECSVQVGGTTVFRGVVQQAVPDIKGDVVRVSASDPLGHVDRDFSAPGMASTLGSSPGRSERRRPGLSVLYYVDLALRALGAYASVPQSDTAQWHQSMTGSAYPSVGILEQATQWTGDASGGSPVWPAERLISAPLGDGRVGMVNPYVVGSTRPAGTWAKFHLFHDLYPAEGQSYWVQVLGAGSDSDGFGLAVGGSQVSLIAWPVSGTRQTLGSWTITPTRRRILVEYDPGTHRLAVRFSGEAAPVATNINPGTPLPSLAATTQVRVVVRGRGTIPAVSLHRRASHIGVHGGSPVRVLDTRQGASFDLDQDTMDRRRMTDHAPIFAADAVQWLVDAAARDMAVLYTDDEGVVHWADPKAFTDLPVSHVISDDGSGIDLDDLTLQQAIRRPYSRVRVVGKFGPMERHSGPGPEPNILLARADQEVVLRAGSAPVQMFLGPHQDGMAWIGGPEEIDLSLRYAGEPTTQPWHKPDDYARGRGSWGGGHVRKINPDENGDDIIVRWALSTEWGQITTNPRPADVLYDVEWINPETIRVTISPGPGLDPDEEYVNLPRPDSASLQTRNQKRLTEYLPRIRGWHRRMKPVDVVGESALMADTEDAPVYVHEAGDAISTVAFAQRLAQDMADRYTQHFGQVTVEADLDVSVKVGQRIHIKPTSRSDVTLDAVVTGIPSRRWPECTMTLSCWVMNVALHGVTWAEQQALTSGTWGDQQPDGTWAQHAAGVLVDAQPTSETSTDVH